LQTLALLEDTDLKALGHNSADYIHTLTEALKLAFADREAYYTDPALGNVPLPTLISSEYAAERRKLIRPDRAWPEMPPPGQLGAMDQRLRASPPNPNPEPDTSYVCAADRWGNIFSATPSDGSYNAPVIPELGIIPSPRGSQSWADPDHPSSVAPGKRPRLTPSPAIAIQPGKFKMPFGTPGGDVQTQAMLQVFMNIHVFGMEPQEAVEAPRCASYSYPGSFEPHSYHPGLVYLEKRIDGATGDALSRMGHKVDWWPEWTWLAGAVCTVVSDEQSGVLKGAADPRRPSYAVGL